VAVDAGTDRRKRDSALATSSGGDVTRTAAKATAAGVAVVAIAFGLWKVRSIIILLLLALTFAAAIRPGVEWLTRRRVPQSVAILAFFVAALGTLALFFWLAVPPALRELEHALNQPGANGVAVDNSTGIRHDALVWVNRQLHQLPHGSNLLHPIASYGRKATSAVVAVLFTLAATWYWVSERDRMIKLLSALAPQSKREKARQTYLAIDSRLGSYTRLKFLMVAIVGAVLAAGFYLVGLHYWLLLGGFVGLVEIVPVVGPLIGAILVVVVGLSQSVHVAALGLLVVVVVREFQSYVVNPAVLRAPEPPLGGVPRVLLSVHRRPRLPRPRVLGRELDHRDVPARKLGPHPRQHALPRGFRQERRGRLRSPALPGVLLRRRLRRDHDADADDSGLRLRN
jgi:predicted PurR-regulated permease PerM